MVGWPRFQSSTTAIVACSMNNALFVLQATIAVVEDWEEVSGWSHLSEHNACVCKATF